MANSHFGKQSATVLVAKRTLPVARELVRADRPRSAANHDVRSHRGGTRTFITGDCTYLDRTMGNVEGAGEGGMATEGGRAVRAAAPVAIVAFRDWY